MQTLVKWKISLSNGETFYEGKGNYQRLPGELSPWEKLKVYISENSLRITSISLYTDQGQTFNLPSAGKNPKFHLFDSQAQPTGYSFFRCAGQDINEGWDDFAVAVAEYADYKLQLWVNNNHPENCWALVAK